MPRPPVPIHLALLLMAATTAACSETGLAPQGAAADRATEETPFCLDSGFQILQGARKDAIPALVNPPFVQPGTPGTELLRLDDHVVGIVLDGEALALPLYVLRWHEIVNVDRIGLRVAVTYCPLTGTAVAFDRSAVGGSDLGVSGLLVENNLIMYDRSSDESLFGQMLGSGLCGRLKGRELPRLPVMVTRFAGWRSLHPDTKVLSTATGYDRDYSRNPYLDYDRLDAPPLFITQLSQDKRRLPKELVLGIPSAGGPGMAVPYLELADHERAGLSVRVGSTTATVLWDRSLEVAAAYAPQPRWVDGYLPPSTEAPTFSPAPGGFTDSVTGSLWSIEGVALEGPAQDSRLVPVPGAMEAYWFAWAAFNRGTALVTDF